MQDLDVGHVAHAQRLVLARRDHHFLDLPDRFRLAVDDDLEGEWLPLDPADGVQAALLGDLIGEVGGGHAGRQQVVGPGDHFNLAHIAAGDVGIQHVRNGLDERGELIVGVVAELGGVVAAGQHQRQDGEDRGRHLLDGEVHVGRQLGAAGADAVPGERLGVAHVGAGIEIDGDFAAAADGLGAHLGDAEDAADGILQGPGDLELHLGDVEIRHAGHDGDARESDFGINAAGHARGAVDAAGGEQATGDDDGSEVRPCSGRQVHGARCPLAVQPSRSA